MMKYIKPNARAYGNEDKITTGFIKNFKGRTKPTAKFSYVGSTAFEVGFSGTAIVSSEVRVPTVSSAVLVCFFLCAIMCFRDVSGKNRTMNISTSPPIAVKIQNIILHPKSKIVKIVQCMGNIRHGMYAEH